MFFGREALLPSPQSLTPFLFKFKLAYFSIYVGLFIYTAFIPKYFLDNHVHAYAICIHNIIAICMFVLYSWITPDPTLNKLKANPKQTLKLDDSVAQKESRRA